MKKIYLTICSSIIYLNLFAQVEVPVLVNKKGFVMESKAPFETLKVSFEGDLEQFFANLIFTDSTLIFKSSSEKSAYEKQVNKYKSEVAKQNKAKAKGTSLGAKETPQPYNDLSQFIDEREILKPGVEVEVWFDKYLYSQKNVIVQILIKTDFNNTVKVDGLFEKIDGNLAVVDGQAVSIKENIALIGKNGFEGKKFSTFKEMMYGMEIEARGKRQPNGVILIESGYVKANEFSETDRKIAQSYKNIMKRSANADEISVADTITLKVLKNITIQTYINRIANAVTPKYMKNLPDGTPGKIDFSFVVIKDNSFNACAYPDGTIHIHTGLLEKIENDAQLAAIIGHEIAHVVYKHSRKNYEKQKTQTILSELSLAGAFLGVKGADIAVLMTALGGPILLSNYSRELEEQADRIGLTYLYDAGYDPREAPKIWQRLAYDGDTELPSGSLLEAVVTKGTKGINSIYSSHPEASKRYRNLSLLIAQNYQDTDLSNLNTGVEGYEGMKKTLKRVLKGLPEKEEVRAAVPVKKTESSQNSVKDNKKTPLKQKGVTPKKG